MTITNIKSSNADWVRVGDDAHPDYVHAETLLAQGVPWKQVTRLTGVGYSSGWLFVQRRRFAAEGGLIDLASQSVAQAKPIVAQRRAEGESWGLIAARCGTPEGLVRRLFTEATNVDHQGLRNGHGGRFYQGNAEAYAPAPKVGWVRTPLAPKDLPNFIKAGLLKAGVGEAEATELSTMKLNELRAMAKSLGLPTAGTKKDLAEAIGQAFA
jgi:hypothetical protein